MPHDTQVNADLALVMANAGWSQTAVDWASFAVDRKYNPPDSFQATLGWALYLANRAEGAVAAYGRMSDPMTVEHAAALIRAGRREEGAAMIAALKVQKPESLLPKVLLFGTGGRVQRTADGASALKRDLAELIPRLPMDRRIMTKGDGKPKAARKPRLPRPIEPTPPAATEKKPALGGSF